MENTMRLLFAFIFGALSTSCGGDDNSEVDPASLEKVQQEFDSWSMERFPLHQKQERLGECLFASWSLAKTTVNDLPEGIVLDDRFNLNALMGNVCKEALTFTMPSSNTDAIVLLSVDGSTSKWCGVEWEWSGKWHQVTVEPGETMQVGSLLSFRGIEAVGTDEFSVQIAWPRPGDRPEEYCKYNQSTHYVRTYLPNLSEIETAPLVEHLRQESP